LPSNSKLLQAIYLLECAFHFAQISIQLPSGLSENTQIIEVTNKLQISTYSHRLSIFIDF